MRRPPAVEIRGGIVQLEVGRHESSTIFFSGQMARPRPVPIFAGPSCRARAGRWRFSKRQALAVVEYLDRYEVSLPSRPGRGSRRDCPPCPCPAASIDSAAFLIEVAEGLAEQARWSKVPISGSEPKSRVKAMSARDDLDQERGCRATASRRSSGFISGFGIRAKGRELIDHAGQMSPTLPE